jgi:hypothetical protein
MGIERQFSIERAEGARFRIGEVDPKANNKPVREARSRQALRMETRGLILIALAIFIVYLVRYLHLLHRSTP